MLRDQEKNKDNCHFTEYTLKQMCSWAGHIARMKDNRWTRRCTEWQPRSGKRSRGRPSRRWQDDIARKEGTTWNRKAAGRRQRKTLMEGYILQWMDNLFVGWLLNVLATGECISGTDLHRQFYVLPH